MGDLLEALKNLWKKYKSQIILGLALVTALLCLGFSLNHNRIQSGQYEHNLTALTDTVELYKTKSGKLAAEKTLLLGDIDVLKATNEELYQEIKDLKVKNPTQVIKIETEVVNEVHDTTYLINPLACQRKDFQFNNEWRNLEGFVELKDNNLGLGITKDITYVDYTLAIKDGRVYLTSSNPYVQYREIQGLTIPKQKKPAFSVGIGPTVAAGYDPINRKPGILVGVGLSFNYNLVTF